MNAILTALAEPNRLQIVDLLLDGPRPVGDIVEQLHLRQPQVSKHLRVLSEAGLVEVRPLAQQRIYSLRSGPFRELSEWLDSYRGLWQERMDRFDEVLQDLKQTDDQKETGDDHGSR